MAPQVAFAPSKALSIFGMFAAMTFKQVLAGGPLQLLMTPTTNEKWRQQAGVCLACAPAAHKGDGVGWYREPKAVSRIQKVLHCASPMIPGKT
jgi:hypothetical protein